MTREYLERPQRHVLCQRCAGIAENFVKDPAHGEHGWTRVNRSASHGHFAHFAAGPFRTIHDDDLDPLNGQVQRRDQTTNSRANDDYALGWHCLKCLEKG